MNNRFSSCKSLKDLYVVFENEEGILEYSNLSDEELDRVAIVFEANLPNKVDMPDVPLTNAGYNFVWNVVVDTINKQSKKEEEETMRKPNIPENVTMKDLFDAAIKETVSKKDKAKATVYNVANKFEAKAKSAKVEAGKDREDFMGGLDESVTEIMSEVDPLLTNLDEILGGTSLKEEICAIMYSNVKTKSKNGFFTAARKCREAVERKIEVLKAIDPDDKLGRIAALKVYVESVDADGNVTHMRDENGNMVVDYTQTIWMAFANAVVYVCKRAARRIKRDLGTNASTNIFGAVGASIAGVFASIGKVVFNVAKIAGNVLLFAASYAVAGVIKAVDFIITAIKWAASKVDGWFNVAKKKFTKKDIEEEMEDIMEQAYFGNDADEEDEVTE